MRQKKPFNALINGAASPSSCPGERHLRFFTSSAFFRGDAMFVKEGTNAVVALRHVSATSPSHIA